MRNTQAVKRCSWWYARKDGTKETDDEGMYVKYVGYTMKEGESLVLVFKVGSESWFQPERGRRNDVIDVEDELRESVCEILQEALWRRP